MAASEAFWLAAQQAALQAAQQAAQQRPAILRRVDMHAVLRRLQDEREEQDLVLLGIL